MSDLELAPEIAEKLALADAAPEAPLSSPGKWMKDNLFSSVGNTVQTVLFGAVLLGILRWLLGLIVADERDWSAVTTNMRLLFTYIHPADQYGRVWFTLGTLLVMGMFTVAAFHLRPSISAQKLLTNVAGIGVFSLIVGLITPVSLSSRVPVLIFGALLVGIAAILLSQLNEPQNIMIPFWQLMTGIAIVLLAIVWLFPFGNHLFEGGQVVKEPGTIKQSTKNWLSLMIGLTMAGLVVGKAIAQAVPAAAFKMSMVLWWIIGPAFLLFLVLRDPAFDWGYVLSVDIPIALLFGIGGAALLYFLATPGNEAIARIVGLAILAIGVITFILGATGDVSMLQKIRLSILVLGLVALLSPTFSGEKRVRLRFALTWLGFVLITHWLITGINTPSTLDITAPPFIGGFVISVTIGYYVMLASFPIGVLMALARTSKMPLFRVMATGYIEGVRGVPLIVILFFFDNLLNLFLPTGMSVSKLGAIFVGFTLFSAAYMAENIRGGLQSIRRGQSEASDALGLTTLQRTVFIILPQALRVSIPNLVGQAIATFKETSLVSIIGAVDLLNVARNTIPGQPAFLGHAIAPLLFISGVYWFFAFSMSKASRNLETKLGVGAR